GKESREFVFDSNFSDKTADDKNFVEDLWARRKVGYLLDQIRLNGEKKELVEEVVTLAKRYGITTRYTSYLVVPDGPGIVAGGGGSGVKMPLLPPALAPQGGGGVALKVKDLAKQLHGTDGKGGVAKGRDKFAADALGRPEA